MKVFLSCVVIIFLAVLILHSVLPTEKKDISKNHTSIPKAEIIKTISSKDSNWNYSKWSDEKTEFGSCKSTNLLEIGGESSSFQLNIRMVGKSERGSTVFINLLNPTAGAFVTNQKDFEILILEFDNDKPLEISYVSPADVGGDVIYLKSFEKIIAKLRTSKKLRIKAEFRDVGWKFIEFDVSNFKL